VDAQRRQRDQLPTIVGRTELTTFATVDVPGRRACCGEIFQSPEFGTKFPWQVFLILHIPDFLQT